MSLSQHFCMEGASKFSHAPHWKGLPLKYFAQPPPKPKATTGRDFEQKVETRPRLERAEIKTKHETFETTYLQNITIIFNIKF